MQPNCNKLNNPIAYIMLELCKNLHCFFIERFFQDWALLTPLSFFYIFLTAFIFHVHKFSYIVIENQYQYNNSGNKKPHT